MCTSVCGGRGGVGERGEGAGKGAGKLNIFIMLFHIISRPGEKLMPLGNPGRILATPGRFRNLAK